jgi:hypothetical protein
MFFDLKKFLDPATSPKFHFRSPPSAQDILRGAKLRLLVRDREPSIQQFLIQKLPVAKNLFFIVNTGHIKNIRQKPTVLFLFVSPDDKERARLKRLRDKKLRSLPCRTSQFRRVEAAKTKSPGYVCPESKIDPRHNRIAVNNPVQRGRVSIKTRLFKIRNPDRIIFTLLDGPYNQPRMQRSIGRAPDVSFNPETNIQSDSSTVRSAGNAVVVQNPTNDVQGRA